MQTFGTLILGPPETQTPVKKNALGGVLILVYEYECTKKHAFLPLGVALVQTGNQACLRGTSRVTWESLAWPLR